MRYSAVDMETFAAITNTQNLPPGHKVKYQYLPRIRCHDCPGKLYTPGPGMTVDNFEVHLRNRQHKQNVDERVARTVGAPVNPNLSSASASPAPGNGLHGGPGASPSPARG